MTSVLLLLPMDVLKMYSKMERVINTCTTTTPPTQKVWAQTSHPKSSVLAIWPQASPVGNSNGSLGTMNLNPRGNWGQGRQNIFFSFCPQTPIADGWESRVACKGGYTTPGCTNLTYRGMCNILHQVSQKIQTLLLIFFLHFPSCCFCLPSVVKL